MRLMPTVPTVFSDLYTTGKRYFSYPQDGLPSTVAFFPKVGRVALAALICLAYSKGSIIGTTLLATASIPATMIALGGMIALYGLGTLKAAVVAGNLWNIGMGLGALYAGWQILDNYQLPQFFGTGRDQGTHYHLSHSRGWFERRSTNADGTTRPALFSFEGMSYIIYNRFDARSGVMNNRYNIRSK